MRDKPWLAISDQDMAAAATVPTMLSDEERQLYFWLARDWATGTGAMVDLGCFAGGSTALLAEGARAAGRDRQIFAYDRFHADLRSKQRFLYSAGIPKFDGTDILPLSDILLEPWQPGITLIKGQIETQKWDRSRIELLTVDAAKSVAVLDHIAGAFYPSLRPGHSLVVHQDMLHWKTPWIAAQMERMGEWFEAVAHSAPDTVIYRCRKRVTRDALAAGRITGLDDAALTEAIGAAAQTLSGFGIAARLEALAGVIRANPGARVASSITRKT
jgi:hypothetical protein